MYRSSDRIKRIRFQLSSTGRNYRNVATSAEANNSVRSAATAAVPAAPAFTSLTKNIEILCSRYAALAKPAILEFMQKNGYSFTKRQINLNYSSVDRFGADEWCARIEAEDADDPINETHCANVIIHAKILLVLVDGYSKYVTVYSMDSSDELDKWIAHYLSKKNSRPGETFYLCNSIVLSEDMKATFVQLDIKAETHKWAKSFKADACARVIKQTVELLQRRCGLTNYKLVPYAAEYVAYTLNRLGHVTRLGDVVPPVAQRITRQTTSLVPIEPPFEHNTQTWTPLERMNWPREYDKFDLTHLRVFGSDVTRHDGWRVGPFVGYTRPNGGPYGDDSLYYAWMSLTDDPESQFYPVPHARCDAVINEYSLDELPALTERANR